MATEMLYDIETLSPDTRVSLDAVDTKSGSIETVIVTVADIEKIRRLNVSDPDYVGPNPLEDSYDSPVALGGIGTETQKQDKKEVKLEVSVFQDVSVSHQSAVGEQNGDSKPSARRSVYTRVNNSWRLMGRS